VADPKTPPNVHEPEGAWAFLRDVLSRSDPAREGGPEFYVPEEVRTALQTALIDADDCEMESLALLKHANAWRDLLKRAAAVCVGPAYARLRKDIDEALKNG
jgi:hypothetical protein